uniref:uncharacterized protein zp3c isoform X2 n=1 Tax=Scatophagus argus TaxID=75038 RepID=UPI001ED839AE|nr:uncharacterized protein zp3c isoform X2 [Scatophagus argus]
MEMMYAGLLLLLFCSAYSYQFASGRGYGLSMQDPDLEWERLETASGEGAMRASAPQPKFWRSTPSGESQTPEAKQVPEYVIVTASQVQKELFKPEKSARPLPNSVREMLLGATIAPKATGSTTSRKALVEILCHIDRMYVRVRKEVFRTRDAYKYLKLGTCPVNQGTKEHYYLLYLLKNDCGFKKESNVDSLSVRNVLHYKPVGPVLREKPFDIPLQCKFPRFFHSFKVGFYPKLQGGTVFKALQPKSSFTITPQDALGNEITGTKTYILGQPMYFEAKPPDSTATSGDKRIYINKCFMTPYQDPNSNPKYIVIDNRGNSICTVRSLWGVLHQLRVQRLAIMIQLPKSGRSCTVMTLCAHAVNPPAPQHSLKLLGI